MIKRKTLLPVPASPSPDKTLVEVINVSAGYHGKTVIKNISCKMNSGELLGIIGPNGCGKSTLLKTLSGCLSPTDGQVHLDTQTLSSMSRQSLARTLAMLPQYPQAPVGMTVRDLIRCGRAPHARWFQPFTDEDRHAIDHAIDRCKLAGLVDRPLAELSGGERQRSWIAMTLAQQTRILLLDEPISALDIGHQLDVMNLLDELAHCSNLAVVVVMHDINIAIRYCDRILVMKDGYLAGEYQHSYLTNWSLLEDVFEVRAHPVGRHQASRSEHLAFSRSM